MSRVDAALASVNDSEPSMRARAASVISAISVRSNGCSKVSPWISRWACPTPSTAQAWASGATSSATIRAWASKGFIAAHKVNTRTLFDIAEVRAHADTVWQPVQTGRTA